ncbi:MAG: hypothetical protein U0800_22765 [Isosphaeraceae bacterium]
MYRLKMHGVRADHSFFGEEEIGRRRCSTRKSGIDRPWEPVVPRFMDGPDLKVHGPLVIPRRSSDLRRHPGQRPQDRRAIRQALEEAVRMLGGPRAPAY